MRIKDLHTAADFRRMAAEKQGGRSTSGQSTPGAPNSNKFGAVKVVNANGSFDSKHEANVVDELLRLQEAGYVRDVETDRNAFRYEIKVNEYFICSYTADASFVAARDFELQSFEGTRRIQTGQKYIVDAKSEITRKKRDYILVKKLMRAIHGVSILEL